MPTIRFGLKCQPCYLTFGGVYKPGDPAPTGYLAWHEWAEVQHKAGLRQVRCCDCGLCRYPQELTPDPVVHTAYRKTRKGEMIPVQISGRRCVKCDEKRKAASS